MDGLEIPSQGRNASFDPYPAEAAGVKKKKPRKKRKAMGDGGDDTGSRKPGVKKVKKRKEGKLGKEDDGGSRVYARGGRGLPTSSTREEGKKKKGSKNPHKMMMEGANILHPGFSPAQQAVNEQMRKALEEDRYSALGSIVEADEHSSDEDEDGRTIVVAVAGSKKHVNTIRLDRNTILSAMRKRLRIEGMRGHGANVIESKSSTNIMTSSLVMASSNDSGDLPMDDVDAATESQDDDGTIAKKRKKKKKKGKRGGNRQADGAIETATDKAGSQSTDDILNDGRESMLDDDFEDDGGSIFGHTTGSINATWVECDKCKKWRRLRGVVDDKKLPSKWYCFMNKNDPERSKCTSPEEEYETPNTPENAADARTRKHLRLWVRRLQCNEQYESTLPNMTRNQKKLPSREEPYEWVRCCNASCGKWRVLLRCMDARQNVIDTAKDREWYCVMNTWDEKTASCAAPQETLPALGCPPWVIQDVA